MSNTYYEIKPEDLLPGDVIIITGYQAPEDARELVVAYISRCMYSAGQCGFRGNSHITALTCCRITAELRDYKNICLCPDRKFYLVRRAGIQINSIKEI